MLRPSRKAKIACRNRKLQTSERPVFCKTDYFIPPRNRSLAAGSAIFTGDFLHRRYSSEARFYITLLILLESVLGPMIRDHWAVENGLHWTMDMAFLGDECRIRTKHAPANFTTLRHMAQNLYRESPAKDSIRRKRKTVGWDDEYLASLIVA